MHLNMTVTRIKYAKVTPQIDTYHSLLPHCALAVKKLRDQGSLSDEFINDEIVPLLLEPVQPCYVTPFSKGVNYPLKRPEYHDSTCYVALLYQHVHRTIRHILLYEAKGYTRFQVIIPNSCEAVTPGTSAVLREELTDAIKEIVRLVGRDNVDVEFGILRFFQRSDGWYELVVNDDGKVVDRFVGPEDPR